jgi:hypothetical protein
MNIPPLVGMTMTVTGGSVERNEAGRLEAHLSAIVPFQSLQTLNEKLGLDEMHLTSLSEALSTDEGSPTVFESTRSVVLPKGEVALDMLSWKQVALPMNITATVHTKATGVLRGNEFAGEFVGTFTYKEIHLLLIALGTFRIHLA